MKIGDIVYNRVTDDFGVIVAYEDLIVTVSNDDGINKYPVADVKKTKIDEAKDIFESLKTHYADDFTGDINNVLCACYAMCKYHTDNWNDRSEVCDLTVMKHAVLTMLRSHWKKLNRKR